MKEQELVVFWGEYGTKVMAGVVCKELKKQKGLQVSPANDAISLKCLEPFVGFVPYHLCIVRTTDKELVRRTMCTLWLVGRQYEQSRAGVLAAYKEAVKTTLDSLRDLIDDRKK